jgi:hypothetical protein
MEYLRQSGDVEPVEADAPAAGAKVVADAAFVPATGAPADLLAGSHSSS